jgi:Fe-S cluster assembly iron-binding protein IscA
MCPPSPYVEHCKQNCMMLLAYSYAKQKTQSGQTFHTGKYQGTCGCGRELTTKRTHQNIM